MKYWIRCLRCLHDSGRMRYAEFGKKQIQCIVLVLISSIATIMFPNLVSKIIDEGIGIGELTNIYKYSIFLGTTGVIMIISEYAYQMSFYKFSQKFILEIKELFFSKLLKTNIAFWSKHTAGDMFKILEDDIAAIENMFTRSISSIISNVFILIGVTSYLIHMHRKIGFFLIIFTVIIVWIQKRYGKKLENFAYPFREEVAMFSSYTNEVLNNIINIEMCGIKEKVNENYCEKNKKIVKKTMQQLKLITILKSIISSYSICSLFVIMMIGAGEVLVNKMSVGDLVSLTMYIQWLLGPIVVLGDAYAEFKSNLPIFERIFNVIDSKDIVYEGQIYPKSQMIGEIEIRNIKFSYMQGKEVFHDFLLTVQPGQTLGITGKNGCGKTTIFRMILKLCEPESGDVIIDKIPVKNYATSYLSSQIGCLLQDEFIISGSLREVIDVEQMHSDYEILSIMEDFCLNVEEFSEGLDTRIGENTSNLSGGQVQKISLARLFLQDKAVYLLDEPTAAIDLGAEEIICCSIKKYLEGKTAIIITHREKILSICDRKLLIV